MQRVTLYVFSILACVFALASLLVPRKLFVNAGGAPALIPRKILFGNAARFAPLISPDGTKLSYSAPFNGVMNLWVKPIDGSNSDRVVTRSTKQPIDTHYWAPDSKQLLYLQDNQGDENYHLYGVDLETMKVRDYTPFEGISVPGIETSLKCKDSIVLAMNKDNKELFDYYKLNLNDGNLVLILKNPGNYAGVVFDKQLQPRAIKTKNKDGSSDVLYWSNNAWLPVFSWNPENAFESYIFGLADDNVSLYLKDTTHSNTSSLILFNPSTKASEVIANDPEYDLGGILQDLYTNKLLAVTFYREKKVFKIIDEQFGTHLRSMLTLSDGDLALISNNDDQTKYTLAFDSDCKGKVYYMYDVCTKKGTLLFKARPDLETYALAPMKSITFKSRDGLTIHGYLTLPVGVENKNLPLVIYVHGGPQVRDEWGYEPTVQWLSNRGYAVLQVNFRGSTGYGKAFERAGDREWGRNMQNDLVDAVEWAIQNGIADPKRVAIFGGSYGGYAALAGVTFTPDLFACAISLCGPSNLITLLESMPPYWSIFKADLYRRVGDISETEFLKSRSPLFAADKLKVPLFIAQGARDPRVKQAESEQFVAALKAKNIPYEYLLIEDEGHGFAKPENDIQFHAAAEAFLAKHLGGRFEA